MDLTPQRRKGALTAAHQILAARRRAGLSQAEAARRLGVAPQNLCAWERGRRRPTTGTLFRVLAILAAIRPVRRMRQG